MPIPTLTTGREGGGVKRVVFAALLASTLARSALAQSWNIPVWTTAGCPTVPTAAAEVITAINPGDVAVIAGQPATFSGTYAKGTPRGLKYAFDSTHCTNTASGPTISGGKWSFQVNAPAAGYRILTVCDAGNPAIFGISTSFWVHNPSNGYTGPCDASAGNCAPGSFIGMRAYKAAYANGLTLAGAVQRGSDNQNFHVPMLADGYADQADAIAWAGTDATFTGSISGTTLTVSAVATGTLHLNDQLSGSNLADPTYITALGTGGGGTGTYTVNKSQSAASGTITATVALYWTAVTEQVCALAGRSNCDATQSTQSLMPIFLARCNPVTPREPCMVFDGGRYLGYGTGAENKLTGPPFSIVAWVNPTRIGEGSEHGIFGSTARILQAWGTPEFRIGGTGKLELSNQTNQTAASSGTVSADTLTDMSVTYDAGNNLVFYAGGSVIGTANQAFNLQGYWQGVSVEAAVGVGYPTPPGQFLAGHVTYLMTTGMLSSAQIAALHAAGG